MWVSSYQCLKPTTQPKQTPEIHVASRARKLCNVVNLSKPLTIVWKAKGALPSTSPRFRQGHYSKEWLTKQCHLPWWCKLSFSLSYTQKSSRFSVALVSCYPWNFKNTSGISVFFLNCQYLSSKSGIQNYSLRLLFS